MSLISNYFYKQNLEIRLHNLRVAYLAYCFSLYLNMEYISSICLTSGFLHDIGKIYIPDKILNKPSILTEDEFDIIKNHPIYSYLILKSEGFSSDICNIVKHHHENYDGSGYPDHLSKNNIPYGARILRIVDTFDSLTSNRPYRKSMSIKEALTIIKKEQKYFDPYICKLFTLWINSEYENNNFTLDHQKIQHFVYSYLNNANLKEVFIK